MILLQYNKRERNNPTLTQSRPTKCYQIRYRKGVKRRQMDLVGTELYSN